VPAARRQSGGAPPLQKKTGPFGPVSDRLQFGDQSLCQVWLLQISPPSTQPLILSVVPESVALPE
jgi:hypothetical protein